jgi:hypothetical protein
MFREVGTKVSPVTMPRPSPRTAALPCLPLDIKESLKEDWGPFALGFLLWAFVWGLFALGFLLEAFTFGFCALIFCFCNVGGIGKEKNYRREMNC